MQNYQESVCMQDIMYELEPQSVRRNIIAVENQSIRGCREVAQCDTWFVQFRYINHD